ncbi:MAG: hypothetical protein Q8O40_01530 [Chloroflexota bacterium]|nr:hypothetical protein [Chloroflexota bacterium]
MNMGIGAFAKALPHWYGRYGKWAPGLVALTSQLEQKVAQETINPGYLNMATLVAIAEWGGNQYNIKEQLQSNNTNAYVIAQTRGAIQLLRGNGWKLALDRLMQIKGWGLTYATKTLRFICPQDHPAFDSLLRRGIVLAPPLAGTPQGYERFIDICRQMQKRTSAPGPRPDGSWWLADVEMALFAFVRNDGKLTIPSASGITSLRKP